jgi:RimJ/RimL family protein N-acetyltransferase
VVEPSWGQGYASEALRALLTALLGDAAVRRVVAETMVDHLASRRVMEEAGMTYQGCRTAVVDGEVQDVVTYAIGSELAAGRRQPDCCA